MPDSDRNEQDPGQQGENGTPASSTGTGGTTPESSSAGTGERPQDLSTGDATGANGGGQTYTQDQIDAMIANRLERERKKFADYDELKKAAEKLRELEQAQLSEQERIAAELETEKQARQQAEQIAEQARNEARATLLRAAVLAEAGRQRARVPDDAWRLVDQSLLTLSEEGTVSGAEQAVKTLIEAGRLPVMDKPAAPSLDGGAGSGERPGQTPTLTDEELEIARKMGLTPEDYAKAKT